MPVAYPLTPVPSQYKYATWRTSSTPQNGIIFPGETVTIKFSGAISPTSYRVVDYDGNIIVSGSLGGGSITTHSLPAPAGGWKNCEYRAYYFGSAVDALFGNSCCTTAFIVTTDSPNFVPRTTGYPIGVGTTGTQFADIRAKSLMGLGTTRLTIQDARAAYAADLADCVTNADISSTYWTNPGAQYLDPARPRYSWCNFVNTAVDVVYVPQNPANPNSYVGVYCVDSTQDGSQIFVDCTPTGGTGAVIKIYSPTSADADLKETWTVSSAANAETQINAGSSYVRAYQTQRGTPGTMAKTAIGRVAWNAVTDVVSTLYAHGVTRFEGPSNEPDLRYSGIVHEMMLFQAAVRNGNALAKAIGPCPVNIDPANGWDLFLAGGGANYCDELSFHAYGYATDGDLNLGRYSLTRFKALLAVYGVTKPMWQTESIPTGTIVRSGVLHRHDARSLSLDWLMGEQAGITMEQNVPWFDINGGFWEQPKWFETGGDGVLEATAALARTCKDQIWGQTHYAALSFGGVGDNIFIGSVFRGSSSQTVMLMATSYIPNSTVTLTVSDAGPLVVSDAWGNLTSYPVSGGKVTVPVREIPTYVQLSHTASVSVDHALDWVSPTNLWSGSRCTVDGVSVPGLSTGFLTDYALLTGIYIAPGNPPTTIDLIASQGPAANVSQLVIWCGSCWQTLSTLLAFEVWTSLDTIHWTHQLDVDVSSDSFSANLAADGNNDGCMYETNWKQQWIHSITLPAAPLARAIRIVATKTSYGGEPDLQAATANYGTEATASLTQNVCLQHIAVLGTARVGGEVRARSLHRQ